MDNIATAVKKVKEGFVGEKRIVLPPNIKKRVAQNGLSRNFYLTAIGYYPQAAFHDIVRKWGCSQYILIYCVEGEGTISVQNESFHVKPNNFFIIPKNVPHHYFSAPENPWTIYWLHFCGDYDDLLFSRSLIDHKLHVHSIPYDQSRIQLFEKVYQLLEHSYNEQEMEIMNLHLLHFVSSLIYYQETDPSSQREDTVSNSIMFMNKHLRSHLSLQDLADQQHISVSHLSRIFKQKTGYSPLHYFNQLKIQKSCQYLYFTDKSIKEICAELGFDDPYYFSRLFSKLNGLSPAKYRKLHHSR